VALVNKARAAQDALDAKAALEHQCEANRAELGAVRTQLEKLKSEKLDAISQLARHDEALQQAELRNESS
jgi:hypothetical protein